MNIEAIKDNIKHMKEVARELYVFTNQIDIIKNLETNKKIVINTEEKRLLDEVITSLTGQLKILNDSMPELVQSIGFFKKLEGEEEQISSVKQKLVQIEYSLMKESQGLH